MRHSWTGTLALTLAATACGGEPAGPRGPLDLTVTTDQLTYSLVTDRVALVTLTNRSDRPVYLPMGIYVMYEGFREGQWREASAWFTVDGVGRSFPLGPGASQTDHLPLRADLPGQPGKYRFRYFVYSDARVRSLLPVEERVSQSITIER